MSIPAPAVKLCKQCSALKALEEFYPHRSTHDRRRGECIACTKLAANKYKHGKADKCRELNRLYHQRPHVKAQQKEYAQSARGKAVKNRAALKWMSRNPEKLGAQMMVRGALLCGFMVRQPCEVCGSTTRVQGHHDDYSKPLEVRWLCHPHHAEHHRLERERSQERA